MDGTAALTSATTVRPADDRRLRELNHRVLNSLTRLASMAGMEARALEGGEGRAALERVRSRMVAVASLYRILASTEIASPVVRADLYLRSVVDTVAASAGPDEQISVRLRAAPCELPPARAGTLGLLVNEAMTNAYKHAFAGRERGRIAISLAERTGGLVLCVCDDGVGMQEGARRGLGASLLEALATDLGGAIEVRSGRGGTWLRVRFPREQ